MEIEEIKNKEIWEDFLLNCEEKTFLDSWNWGEFQKKMGNKIWRLGIFENNRLVGAALITKIVAKRGTFLLIQHGPVFAKASADKSEVLKIFLDELKKIAKKEKASFIRIAPLLERNEENKKLLRDLGFRNSPMHAHAYEATLKLDLTPPEEDLLMGFRKTTRYLIRQAQKNKDIEIYQGQNLKDIEVFNKLYQEVVDLHHFVPFSLDYLRNEFLAFNPDNQVIVFFGKYNPPHQKFGSGGKGEIIASAFVIFWSNIGFYHHAALLPQFHKIPIAYLLQWEAMKEAKKRGCNLYDFWGYVDPKETPNHPWAGPTLFKMGFGGRLYKYVKTQDLSFSKKYLVTYLFEKLRKTKRGL